jgi:tRNA modification GTPase
LQKISDPETKEIIDECLISFFKSPQSFTGEDVAEISIHASSYIFKKIFNILSAIENVRFAEAGEFSKRAFFNGKIDLTQAEAIPDLIASETASQHKQALQQLQGKLGNIYENWRYKLIEISAQIEAAIDFPEDDLPKNLIAKVEDDVQNLAKEIKKHLEDHNIGQKIKQGLSLAILGAPNVGKSSLLNLLAQSEVAIVSDIEGTTRDVVEIHLEIAGVAVRIADTAGLRESSDLIEQEGIKRALKKAESADIKIFLIDASKPEIRPHDEYLIDDNTIIIINKCDLARPNLAFNDAITISIIDKTNIQALFQRLERKILEIIPNVNSPLITQERYRILLKDCLKNLEEFSLQKNIELAAEDLRLAAFALGKISGKIDIENILDAVFSKFCIGK